MSTTKMTTASFPSRSGALSTIFSGVIFLTLSESLALSIWKEKYPSSHTPPRLQWPGLPQGEIDSRETDLGKTKNQAPAPPIGAALRLYSIYLARQKQLSDERNGQSFNCANTIDSYRCRFVPAGNKDSDSGCFDVVATFPLTGNNSIPTGFCASELWLPAQKLFSAREKRLGKTLLRVENISKWEISVAGSPVGHLTNRGRHFKRRHWFVVQGLQLSANKNTVQFCPLATSTSRPSEVTWSVKSLPPKMFPRVKKEPFFLLGRTQSDAFFFNLIQASSSEVRLRRNVELHQRTSLNVAENLPTNRDLIPRTFPATVSGDDAESQAATSPNTPGDERPCERVRFNISLSTLRTVFGSGDITAPSEIHLYDCAGRCAESSSPASHHAALLRLIQQKVPTTFHGIGRQRRGGGCCVPSSFSKEKVQFVHSENGQLRLISLDNMIVSSCGCT